MWKIHQFLSSIKKCIQKEDWFFFCLTLCNDTLRNIWYYLFTLADQFSGISAPPSTRTGIHQLLSITTGGYNWCIDSWQLGCYCCNFVSRGITTGSAFLSRSAVLIAVDSSSCISRPDSRSACLIQWCACDLLSRGQSHIPDTTTTIIIIISVFVLASIF